MTPEEIKKLIAGRIQDEYRKHPNIEFWDIAASKLYSQWDEFFNLKNKELIEQLDYWEKANDRLQEWNEALQSQLSQANKEIERLNKILLA